MKGAGPGHPAGIRRRHRTQLCFSWAPLLPPSPPPRASSAVAGPAGGRRPSQSWELLPCRSPAQQCPRPLPARGQQRLQTAPDGTRRHQRSLGRHTTPERSSRPTGPQTRSSEAQPPAPPAPFESAADTGQTLVCWRRDTFRAVPVRRDDPAQHRALPTSATSGHSMCPVGTGKCTAPQATAQTRPHPLPKGLFCHPPGPHRDLQPPD